MLIVNCVPDSAGWGPIRHVIALASELLQAQVVNVEAGMPSRSQKLSSIFWRRRRTTANAGSCLLVCTGPADLARILMVDNWRARFKHLSAWVIDSFWLEHIASTIRWANPFDHFFVTLRQDVDEWQKITGVPTSYVPWGSDVLQQGGAMAQRQWDIQRLGRQPPQWDDDISNETAARSISLNYQGRVRGQNLTALQNQELVMRLYGNCKYLLAFSNAVNPERWTHPTKEYLTGRWVDALACGAIVAGIAPRGREVEQLLWNGATLELGTVQRHEGLEVIARAVASWTPGHAALNHFMALQRLDWRWRLKTIAEICNVDTAALRGALDQLQKVIGERRAALTPEMQHGQA